MVADAGMVYLNRNFANYLGEIDHPRYDCIFGIITFREGTVMIFVHTQSIWSSNGKTHFSMVCKLIAGESVVASKATHISSEKRPLNKVVRKGYSQKTKKLTYHQVLEILSER